MHSPRWRAGGQLIEVRRCARAGGKCPSGFPGATLADLYDPLAMPPALAAAHTALDKAVDKCYRDAPFPSDRARVEYLFQLYEQLTAPLALAAKPKRAKKAATPKPIPPGQSTPSPRRWPPISTS